MRLFRTLGTCVFRPWFRAFRPCFRLGITSLLAATCDSASNDTVCDSASVVLSHEHGNARHRRHCVRHFLTVLSCKLKHGAPYRFRALSFGHDDGLLGHDSGRYGRTAPASAGAIGVDCAWRCAHGRACCLRCRADHRPRGPRARAQAAGHVHRQHWPTRSASPRLRGGGQLHR